MGNKLIFSLRMIFTGCLSVAIYHEAGPFTAFAILLISLSIEGITAYMRQANKLAGSIVRGMGNG